jgi:hypothetical protein
MKVNLAIPRASLFLSVLVFGVNAQILPNKYVGILYENWFNRYTIDTGTRYIHPNYPPLLGFMWWGEPQIGVYRSDNWYVINVHADQLVTAGVDFVLLDVSNQNIKHADLWAGVTSLLDAYTSRLAQSKRTPKVAFLTSSADCTAQTPCVQTVNIGRAYKNDAEALYFEVLSNARYRSDLFMKYGNKPLIMTFGAGLGCGAPIANGTASTYFECKTADGNRASNTIWSFMDHYPQPPYMNNEWPEEISVSAAQQAPYMNVPAARGRKWNVQTNRNDGYEGQNFDDQWKRARTINPTFVILKSWNEWVAHRINDAAAPCDDNCYVDEFSPEFSNDIEPMSGGAQDLYLKMLTAHVQKFKRNSPDLFFYDSAAGRWHFKEGRGGNRFAASNYTHQFNWPLGNNYQPIVGDFNDDGKTDIGVRDVNTGTWFFAFSNGDGTYANSRNFSWASGAHYQPLVGDFDNNGSTDIGLRDTTTGTWFFAFNIGNGAYANTVNFQWAGGRKFQPLVSDFDGNGSTDIGLRDTTTGTWFFAFYTRPGVYANSRNFSWASGAHYQPLVGDFDCDGKTDIGLRDNTTGMIFLANFDGQSYYNHFGSNYKWRAGARYVIVSQPCLCKDPY